MMLDETVVVVTGGAGLLGRVFVRDIVQNGGIAIVADIDIDAARQSVSELPAKCMNRAHAMKLDITDTASVTGLISSVHERFGRIDSVVNNAYPRNSNYGRKLEDVSYEDFCPELVASFGRIFSCGAAVWPVFQKPAKGKYHKYGIHLWGHGSAL